MISEAMKKTLCEEARRAAEKAYAPYSRFHVGAAILGAGGRIYTGCNVENASYSLTICAERNAATSMVADGEQRLAAVAIYGGKTAGDAAPCGACRQFLLEFADPELLTPVYLVGGDGTVLETDMKELCPYPFRVFHPED